MHFSQSPDSGDLSFLLIPPLKGSQLRHPPLYKVGAVQLFSSDFLSPEKQQTNNDGWRDTQRCALYPGVSSSDSW